MGKTLEQIIDDARSVHIWIANSSQAGGRYIECDKGWAKRKLAEDFNEGYLDYTLDDQTNELFVH